MSVKIKVFSRVMSPRLNDVFQEFLVYIASTTSAINTRNYRSHLKTFVAQHGQRRIGLLKPQHADQWRIELKERALSPTTIYDYTQALRYLDSFIQARYPEAYNPFASHIRNRRPKPRIGHRLPPPEDVITLQKTAVALISQHPLPTLGLLRDAVIVLWIIETGTRRSETARLHVDMMGLDNPHSEDTEAGKINVYEATLPHAKTDEYHDEIQTVDYTEPMAQALRIWLNSRPPTDREGNQHPHLFVGTGDCGRHKGEIPLSCQVCSRYGKPLTPTVVRYALRNLVELAGVDHISPHQLRHNFGQRAVDASNVEIARQRLRHKDIRTTAVYMHQDKMRRRKGAVAGSLMVALNGDHKLRG